MDEFCETLFLLLSAATVHLPEEVKVPMLSDWAQMKGRIEFVKAELAKKGLPSKLPSLSIPLPQASLIMTSTPDNAGIKMLAFFVETNAHIAAFFFRRFSIVPAKQSGVSRSYSECESDSLVLCSTPLY